MRNRAVPTEGDLYKIYTVGHHSFEIRYGYHEERERGRVEPLPIFPDLLRDPVYTNTGEPVTAYVQYPCGHYRPHQPEQPEEWCGDCLHYGGGRTEMGCCLCPLRRQQSNTTTSPDLRRKPI